MTQPVTLKPQRHFDDAWREEAALLQSGRIDGDRRRRAFRRSLASVLAAWTLEEVEFSAWEFALDGWQRTPPLVSSYDRAFDQYSELIERQEDAAFSGGIGILMEELRNRAQFLQKRAADIRLSSHAESLLSIAQARVAPQLNVLADELEAAEPVERAEIVLLFEKTSGGGLIRAIAHEAGRKNAKVGAGVTAFAEAASRVLHSLVPVAQNLASSWLFEAIKSWNLS